MRDDRTERIGLNEALFREVNERVKGIHDDFGASPGEADFVCECGSESCTAKITMTLDAYESVRADPTHFAIVPGHDVPEVEQVIERALGYVVVEKYEGEPARIAEDTDPRS
jgi:hypothetical protein